MSIARKRGQRDEHGRRAGGDGDAENQGREELKEVHGSGLEGSFGFRFPVLEREDAAAEGIVCQRTTKRERRR